MSINCMIVQIWEVKRVACYARAVASMVATPLRVVSQRLVNNQPGAGVHEVCPRLPLFAGRFLLHFMTDNHSASSSS